MTLTNAVMDMLLKYALNTNNVGYPEVKKHPSEHRIIISYIVEGYSGDYTDSMEILTFDEVRTMLEDNPEYKSKHLLELMRV